MDNPLVVACWAKLLLVGCLAGCIAGAAAAADDPKPAQASRPAIRFAGVRYQVKDVARAVEFYTKHLGFKVERHVGTAFASVSNGNLILWLSGPGSSGARPLHDGRKKEPGGWNRVALSRWTTAGSVVVADAVRFRSVD